MPSYVIKRQPDVDQYLVWSTVVDAPTSPVLSRADMKRFLTYHGHVAVPPGTRPENARLAMEDEAENRILRADATGSSAYGRRHGDWGESFCWREDTGELTQLTRDEVFDRLIEQEAHDHDGPPEWGGWIGVGVLNGMRYAARQCLASPGCPAVEEKAFDLQTWKAKQEAGEAY